VFNILNKSTLNIFPAPWFLATFQLMASAAFMCVLWALRLQPVPQVSWADIKALAPVALFHTIGHVSACVSFSQMAVSFAHVVKAAEPVLSVVLAKVILNESTPVYVWMSLLPIIAGCSLAAMKEVCVHCWLGAVCVDKCTCCGGTAVKTDVSMQLSGCWCLHSIGAAPRTVCPMSSKLQRCCLCAPARSAAPGPASTPPVGSSLSSFALLLNPL
jgi:hypothetical protein